MFYGEKPVILAMGKLDEKSDYWMESCSTKCCKHLPFAHYSIYVWSHEY